MTFVKRALTAVGFFFPLLIIIYFGICVVGGAVAGGKVGMEHPNDPNARQMAAEAGAGFVKDHLGLIVLTSFGGAFVISVGISFSGILPWCRKES